MANTPHLPTWRLQRETLTMRQEIMHYALIFDLPTFLLLAPLRFWVLRGVESREGRLPKGIGDGREHYYVSSHHRIRSREGRLPEGIGDSIITQFFFSCSGCPERDDCRKALVTNSPFGESSDPKGSREGRLPKGIGDCNTLNICGGLKLMSREGRLPKGIADGPPGGTLSRVPQAAVLHQGEPACPLSSEADGRSELESLGPRGYRHRAGRGNEGLHAEWVVVWPSESPTQTGVKTLQKTSVTWGGGVSAFVEALPGNQPSLSLRPWKSRVVAGAGIEPATRGFSVLCSTN
jgi:hypothetical protein